MADHVVERESAPRLHEDPKRIRARRIRYLFQVDRGRRVEHRELIELTSYGAGSGTRYVNRVRFELREISGVRSARLRERARIEHALHPTSSVTLRPYASAEVFYDTRVHGLARGQVSPGQRDHAARVPVRAVSA